MKFLTLDQVKSHIRVDHSGEDAHIELLASASEQATVERLNRQVFDTQAGMDAAVAALTAGDNPMVITDDIKAAMLLIFGHLYANREEVVVGASVATVPVGALFLLSQHRITPGV